MLRALNIFKGTHGFHKVTLFILIITSSRSKQSKHRTCSTLINWNVKIQLLVPPFLCTTIFSYIQSCCTRTLHQITFTKFIYNWPSSLVSTFTSLVLTYLTSGDSRRGLDTSLAKFASHTRDKISWFLGQQVSESTTLIPSHP